MIKTYCLHVCPSFTLNAPIATIVVFFSRLLKCLRSLYGKQCGPRSDCSYRSSLFWAHAVCFYTSFASNVRQLFAAGDFSRHHFEMHLFLGALRDNDCAPKQWCQMPTFWHESSTNYLLIRPYFMFASSREGSD